jgi:serine/threonine-protein kinase RsbW
VKAIATRSWVINASLFEVNKVCIEMTMWLVEQGLVSHLFPIELLTREALNNAIIHGCNLDPERLVSCEIECSENLLYLKVCDDGPGFHWQHYLQNEIADEKHESGRGIQMYRIYADTIEFNPCGNQVILSRRL